MLEDYPTRPPAMDHTAFGVGNEDAIEGVASKLFNVQALYLFYSAYSCVLYLQTGRSESSERLMEL